jgi:vacuolar-type H+-ATPase subunit E/Vma4
MPAAAGPLFDQLRRDAAERAEQRRHDARAEAAGAATAAREAAAERRATAVTGHARTSASALENARADVAQRVRRETLEARAAALDRVFDAAAAAAHGLGGHPRLPAAITRSITRAIAFLPDGPVTVRCAAGSADLVRRALAGLGRTTDDVRVDDTLPLGVRVETADGSIGVDETFGHLLARARPRLAIALARRLEGQSP